MQNITKLRGENWSQCARFFWWLQLLNRKQRNYQYGQARTGKFSWSTFLLPGIDNTTLYSARTGNFSVAVTKKLFFLIKIYLHEI
jgi:hypothetical protein